MTAARAVAKPFTKLTKKRRTSSRPTKVSARVGGPINQFRTWLKCLVHVCCPLALRVSSHIPQTRPIRARGHDIVLVSDCLAIASGKLTNQVKIQPTKLSDGQLVLVALVAKGFEFSALAIKCAAQSIYRLSKHGNFAGLAASFGMHRTHRLTPFLGLVRAGRGGIAQPTMLGGGENIANAR